MANFKTNTERLKTFENYFYSNKPRISYRTYIMFNSTCAKILNEFLTTRDFDLLIDLKEHTMFLGKIYKQIKENFPEEEYLEDIKDKYSYYKDWILSESDTNIPK